MNIAPARQRFSPCIGVCKLDDDSRLCLGCARSGDEIAAWSAMTDKARDAIWAELPRRLEALAVAARRRPPSDGEILD